ncbi:hypothetical protein FB451DRAFT_1570900 [Mycena latifolia]|nr:hypothetical protein FB451DRAFT_1570900 [Mycena latifolia]
MPSPSCIFHGKSFPPPQLILGEYTTLMTAGVLTSNDMSLLVLARARLVQISTIPADCMLAGPFDQLKTLEAYSDTKRALLPSHSGTTALVDLTIVAQHVLHPSSHATIPVVRNVSCAVVSLGDPAVLSSARAGGIDQVRAAPYVPLHADRPRTMLLLHWQQVHAVMQAQHLPALSTSILAPALGAFA